MDGRGSSLKDISSCVRGSTTAASTLRAYKQPHQYSTDLLFQRPTIPNFRIRVRFRVSRVRFRVRVSGPSTQRTISIADLQNGGSESHQSPFTRSRQHVTFRQQRKTLFLCNQRILRVTPGWIWASNREPPVTVTEAAFHSPDPLTFISISN